MVGGVRLGMTLLVCAAPVAAQAPAARPAPGLWRSSITYVELRLPGTSQASVSHLLGKPRYAEVCLTPDAAREYLGVGQGAGCRFTRRLIGPDTVNGAGTCRDGRLDVTVRVSPSTITGVATKNGNDGSFMKAVIRADRVGSCERR